ncbi:GNAT family N-acetyltransferase [soil metagenome]
MSSPPSMDAIDTPLDRLDNAAWVALTTRHAHFAETFGGARRYRVDVSPFCAVDEVDRSWDDLAGLVGPGGTAVLLRRSIGDPPAVCETLMSGVGQQMVATDLRQQPDVDARLLDDGDVDQMLELISLTRPGPFGRRTIGLGDYHGVFDDGRLVAMAGERMTLPGFTDVSAVCTHPDARGRGLAGQLTYLVASRIRERGDRAFLHVADGNPAQSVYERIGFTVRTPVEFVAFKAPSG